MTSTWQDLLVASRTASDEAARAAALRKQAGAYLWAGAQALIEQWLTWDATGDPEALVLYANALEAIGKSRKGQASKIKTVALAARDLDLHPHCYSSLSEAYRNAKRLGM